MHAVFGAIFTVLAFVLAEKARTALPYYGLVNPAALVLLVLGPLGVTLVSHPLAEWRANLRVLARAGVRAEQVVLDVGIGFGKTPEHNLQLLAQLDSFRKWERPLLLGASRKSFIPRVTGDAPAADRLAGSLACACWGVGRGMDLVRTHDVAATRQAMRLTEAIRAQKVSA